MRVKFNVIIFVIVCFLIASFSGCRNNVQESEIMINSVEQVENIVNEEEVENTEEDVADAESSDTIANNVETEETVNAEDAKTEEVVESVEIVENEAVNVDNNNSNLVSLGEFKLTAYCSCVNCCGEYALNRPVDENGNQIVYGASGARLIAGTSVAVDPSVISYYSEIIINGHTYIAHDTGGAVRGNKIDVYFDNHEDAYNFGLQHAEVFVKAN